MNDAISAHWEALSLRPAPHPNHSDSLDNLATVLSAHFDWTSDIVDINEAVSLHRDALKLRPAPHPYHSRSLTQLTIVLEK